MVKKKGPPKFMLVILVGQSLFPKRIRKLTCRCACHGCLLVGVTGRPPTILASGDSCSSSSSSSSSSEQAEGPAMEMPHSGREGGSCYSVAGKILVMMMMVIMMMMIMIGATP